MNAGTTKSAMLPVLVVLVAVFPASAQTKAQAQALFADYQAKERAFDASVADLYCDTADIRNTRRYPDGNERTLAFPAARYKALVRQAMPLARARGDYGTYSDVRYAQEPGGMRITATRYSMAKRYSSPISLLVGPCGGKVGILEELSRSQP